MYVLLQFATKSHHYPIQPTTHSKEGSSEELRRELLVSPWPASYHEDEVDCVDTSLNTIALYFRSQPSMPSESLRVIESRGITIYRSMEPTST